MSEVEPNIEEDVIEAILSAWAEFPNMRLTQLLINAINPEEPCLEVYNVQDGRLIKLLNRFKERHSPSFAQHSKPGKNDPSEND